LRNVTRIWWLSCARRGTASRRSPKIVHVMAATDGARRPRTHDSHPIPEPLSRAAVQRPFAGCSSRRWANLPLSLASFDPRHIAVSLRALVLWIVERVEGCQSSSEPVGLLVLAISVPIKYFSGSIRRRRVLRMPSCVPLLRPRPGSRDCGSV